MATVLFLRHARAASVASDGDSERPLDKQGRRDASVLGAWLTSSGPVIDDVLCSPARRARQTWELVSAELESPPQARLETLLYDAGAEALIRLLRQRSDADDCVLVVGHNPTLHQVAFALAGDGDKAAFDRLTTGFPPCGLVELQFADGWKTLAQGAGTLRRFIIPQDLESKRETP